MTRTNERYWIVSAWGSQRDKGVIKRKRRGAPKEAGEQYESMEEALTFGDDLDEPVRGQVWRVLDLQQEDTYTDYVVVATFTTRGAAQEYADTLDGAWGPPWARSAWRALLAREHGTQER